MKALVLGAAGQLGRALVSNAPTATELVALDRAACDVLDPGQVRATIMSESPDIVINATGYTAVDKAESDPEAAHNLNARAPENLAAVTQEVGAKLVHISTDFVFDGTASTPRGPRDATLPCNVYGKSKLAGERAVIAAAPNSLIVRTAWVYAAHGTNFVKTMLRLMRDRDNVGVIDDQIGTPTYAASLAQGIWMLSAANAAGVYHYTDSGVASWYDFAVAIQEEAVILQMLDRQATVTPIASSDYPTPARRPAYGVLDKAATWELLGRPALHWRVNLRTSLRELQASG